MSLIKAIGIDLAKLVFSIHGVDEHDKCKLRKTIKQNKLLAEIVKYTPCIIGMEAWSGAHYWAREFTKLGFDVRIMASKFVIPYRQNEKNDANDDEAICEAATRPKTRFVSIKSEVSIRKNAQHAPTLKLRNFIKKAMKSGCKLKLQSWPFSATVLVE